MSKISDPYMEGVPQKPYDLLREGTFVLIIVAVVVVILAAVFSSPDYPTVRGEDVAKLQPVAYLETSANILAGNSDLQGYGPPYTGDTANAQEIFGIAPANWFGVRIPIDPAEDLILKPLGRAAVLDQDVAAALQTYRAASTDQQQAWLTAYMKAVGQAAEVNGDVQVPDGDYGPVGVMMRGMLELGKAGLLEGALESNARLPYTLDFTRSLLFFQDDVYHSVADKLDLLGEQWGISHETGPYPGAWWLWPYTFLYQVPPIAASPNGDLLVGVIMMVVFVVLVFLPFLPMINRIPGWVGVYKIIWRDWYARDRKSKKGSFPAEGRMK
jgi:hypothetical protein